MVGPWGSSGALGGSFGALSARLVPLSSKNKFYGVLVITEPDGATQEHDSTGVSYTTRVNFTDGASYLFDRRERPHMVFAEGTTDPVALSNAVRPGGADGDRTFTLLQGLRPGTQLQAAGVAADSPGSPKMGAKS